MPATARMLRCHAFPSTGDPHAIGIALSEADLARWGGLQEREDSLPAYELGRWLRVRDAETGRRWWIRTYPCGLGCRCAAQATTETPGTDERHWAGTDGPPGWAAIEAGGRTVGEIVRAEAAEAAGEIVGLHHERGLWGEHVYYLACRNPETGDVTAVVAIAERPRGPRGVVNVKVQGEGAGPADDRCPAHVLAALTPLDELARAAGPHAAEWRRRCRASLAAGAAAA